MNIVHVCTPTHTHTHSHTHTVSSEVVLAVQCEDGSRRQEKFTDPKSTSLWDVLVKVGVVSDMGGREPVVVYMNSQVCGESDLRTKTLKDLGLSSGRAVVRCGSLDQCRAISLDVRVVLLANSVKLSYMHGLQFVPSSLLTQASGNDIQLGAAN